MHLRHSTLSIALLAGVTATATPLQAQRNGERTRIDTTLTLDGRGVVELGIISGRITVTASSRDEVKIVASVERGVLRLDATSGRVALSVRSDRGRAGEARYEVSIPAGARLQLHGVSGELSARGTRGDVEVNTVSGDVTIGDAQRLTFESVSGDVRATGITGEVHGNTVSGSVVIGGGTGEVSVETVSGEIELTGVRAKAVHTESVSGALDYQGSIDPSGRYEFSSHSGDLRLVLPDNASADVSAETFSGSIESDFPMTLQPTSEGRGRKARRMELRIGNGGARFTAESFSGDIQIRRGSRRGSQEK